MAALATYCQEATSGSSHNIVRLDTWLTINQGWRKHTPPAELAVEIAARQIPAGDLTWAIQTQTDVLSALENLSDLVYFHLGKYFHQPFSELKAYTSAVARGLAAQVEG